MSRVTDSRGLFPRGRPFPVSRGQHAVVRRERDELPFEKVCEAAREIVARKMRGQKLTGKPRMRILQKRNGNGHWFVLYIGKWHLRCTSWENLVRRAAYSPWTLSAVQLTAPRPRRRAAYDPSTKTPSQGL